MAATSTPPRPSPPSTTFRFKSSHHSSVDKPSSHKHQHHHHRRHHHRRHHPSKHRSHPPYPTPPLSPRAPSPNTAFRESLFDALADDEGAAYWEGVYGQPIHTYARPSLHDSSSSQGPRPTSHRNEEGEGENGEQEEGNVHLMDDEEYVSYVRRKMWEKSHGYIFAERARREEGRKRRKEEEEGRERKRRMRREDEEMFEEEEDGENDPRARLYDPFTREEVVREEDTKAWERYQSKWERLLTSTTAPSHDIDTKNKPNDPTSTSLAQGPQPFSSHPPKPIRNLIPWPTSSRTYKSLSPSTIESFFRENVPSSFSTGDVNPKTNDDGESLRKVLKVERVRWHPDKMQQRFGGDKLRMDGETLRGVTMVFQVVDGLYQSLGKG